MNGFYNVIKPIGRSSSDLVIKIRAILRKKLGKKVKVGHLGTLDPLATGVLGVAVGSATKLFDYFLTKKKTYVAECVVGKETDTLDAAGKVVSECLPRDLTEKEIKTALFSFVGEIEQIPPRYSAKSIGGERAYRLALKGIDPELKPCKVTIYAVEFLSYQDQMIRFRVQCSRGTYIRSLCRDLGKKLGYPAYMGSLVREENGTMRLADAVELEAIEQDVQSGFTSLESFGNGLKIADFPEESRMRIDNGVKQNLPFEDGLVSVFVGGIFYGIGAVKDGEMKVIAREA